jgi:NADH-quinone oxidoreductase subunit M
MTFSIPELTHSLRDRPMDPAVQIWIFLALFAGFAVKVPLFPLHTWLPLAHVEAPTAGSVILAGVLLKVGTYGFARFNLPMLPHAAAALMPWLLWLSLAGIVYGALVALAQSDIKRLVAYSSVSHLGFCMLGLFAVNRLSVQGGVLQMVNHGLATGGLFAVVGMLYERYHTREIADFGGLARQLPRLAFFTLVLVLSSIALPGLNGFAGEFLLLVGVFQRGWGEPVPAHWLQLRTIAVLSTSGVVLGAWYMLWMYQRVFFAKGEGGRRKGEDTVALSDRGLGTSVPSFVPSDEGAEVSGQRSEVSGEGSGNQQVSNPNSPVAVRDMSLREVLCLSPLLVMIFWIGLQPSFFLDRMAPTLNDLMKPTADAIENIDKKGEGKGEKMQSAADARHSPSLAPRPSPLAPNP